MMGNTAKSFNILVISLNVLHNYFNNPTNLFSDLYLVKFLDTSAKPSFLCEFCEKELKDYMKSARF